MVKIESKQIAASRKRVDQSKHISIKNPTLSFVVIMLVLIVTIFLSFSILKQYENAVKLVLHTEVVNGKLSQLISNLKDAETGKQGYLLTQDSSFLKPYIGFGRISNQVIKELGFLLKDNPLQQKNLESLRHLVYEREVILKRNLSLLITNTAKANKVNALLLGSSKMDEVRKQVATMIEIENELLDQRTIKKNKISAFTPIFILGIFIIAIIALLLFYIGWRRETILRITAQEKALSTAEASENRIKSFFTGMPAGLCILKGPEHIFEYANSAYVELVGDPDLIGKTVSHVFPEAAAQGFITLLDNVFNTGKTFRGDEMPLMIQQDENVQQYVDFSYQASRDTNGEIEGILVFAYNVTEKVNARKEIEENEKELQKTTTYLKLATDSAQVGIWSHHLKTQILAWSQLHKKMWGYDENRQDMVYEDWFKVILPDDKLKVSEKVEEARVNHTNYDVDYCINRENDGALRCIRSVGKYYYNDKGEAETITGVSIDITEQQEAEERMKEDRELFETTLRNVPSAIYHFDNAGNILYLNEIGANQIGYATVEEVLCEKDVHHLRKKTFETFTILNEQGETMSLDKGSTAITFKSGKSSEVVSQIINKKTGASIWLLSKASPIYDTKGELIKVIAISTDITLRKTSEQTLRKSEEQFRTFADSIQNLAWIANAEGHIYWYNQQWCDYTGTTLEQMEGSGWQTVHHPDHIKKVAAFLEKAWKKDQAIELTFPLRRYDGAYHWFLTRAYPVKDANGKIERWIGTNTDITEQKSFSEALEKKVDERTVELKERNIFIETLIDSSIDFIIVFDKDLRYLSMNKTANRIFEANFPDGVIGKRMDEVIPHVHQSGAYANAQAALKGNLISQKGYKSFYENKYYDVDFIPLKNEKEIYGVMSISRNVTVNVLAAQELKNKNIALKNANAELQSFNYIASHDLQEPLRKIQTFSKFIVEAEQFSDKTKDYFNRITAAGERMQNLIVSLLDFSRTSSTELTFENCNLNMIVEKSMENLKLSIIEKQAVVEYRNLPTIYGSHIQLTQLFTNIIDNAIKYSREEIIPNILITASIVDGLNINDTAANIEKKYHKIEIADNGIGFKKEYESKIFKIFQRLHGQKEYSGTGIGLAIVKKIVTNHNGFIIALGRHGIGATFIVYIPTTTKI